MKRPEQTVGETDTGQETEKAGLTLPAELVRVTDEAGISRLVAWQAFKARHPQAPLEVFYAMIHVCGKYRLDPPPLSREISVFETEKGSWIWFIGAEGWRRIALRHPDSGGFKVSEPEIREGEWWVRCTVRRRGWEEPFETWGRCALKARRKDGTLYDKDWAPEVARARAIRNALRAVFPESVEDLASAEGHQPGYIDVEEAAERELPAETSPEAELPEPPQNATASQPEPATATPEQPSLEGS